MKNNISERIRLLRLSRNLSQQNIADELDITVAAYSNMERGKADITITRLYRIADIFKIDIAELFSTKSLLRENSPEPYGFATKADVESLKNLLHQYQEDMNQIRKEIVLIKKQKPLPPAKKKK